MDSYLLQTFGHSKIVALIGSTIMAIHVRCTKKTVLRMHRTFPNIWTVEKLKRHVQDSMFMIRWMSQWIRICLWTAKEWKSAHFLADSVSAAIAQIGEQTNRPLLCRMNAFVQEERKIHVLQLAPINSRTAGFAQPSICRVPIKMLVKRIAAKCLTGF